MPIVLYDIEHPKVYYQNRPYYKAYYGKDLILDGQVTYTNVFRHDIETDTDIGTLHIANRLGGPRRVVVSGTFEVWTGIVGAHNRGITVSWTLTTNLTGNAVRPFSGGGGSFVTGSGPGLTSSATSSFSGEYITDQTSITFHEHGVGLISGLAVHSRLNVTAVVTDIE